MHFDRLSIHAAALLVLGLPLLAQETTGSVNGTVRDAAQLPINGARVTIAGPKLVRPQETRTSDSGDYLFPNLPPGLYSVTAEAPGFQSVLRKDLELQVGKLIKADFALSVSQQSESVTVEAAGVSVDVQNSSQLTNVSATLTDRLPKDRSFDSMIALAPGARPEPKSGGIQIDGASGAENVYVIDGVDNTNLQTGVLPRNSQVPVELVDEVQVKSGVLDAQYGGGTGGVVSAILKSGGNSFHGQLSFYAETSGMNAGPRPVLRLNPLNDNQAQYVQAPKDGYRLLNPGFALGGPLKKDRLWFFLGSYPEFRNFDRQVLYTGATARQPYQSNVRTDFTVAKFDFAPASNMRTYFSYMYSPDRTHGLLPSALGTDSPNSPWSRRGYRAAASSYNFGFDWTVSPSLLLSTRGGYNYRNFNNLYGYAAGTYYNYVVNNIGLGADLPVPAALQAGAGDFTPNNQVTARDRQTRFNLSQDAGKTFHLAGQHTFKAGYQLNRLSNDVRANYWPDGQILVYWDLDYPALTRPGQFRGSYGYYIDRQMITSGSIASNNHSLYVQDAWRVKRFTFNLGLRAEHEYVPSFQQPGVSNPIGITFPFSAKMAPRFGAAYDLFGNGKAKVYASWGLFYDLMKYEASRVSFGGEKWTDFVYPLNSPDILSIHPRANPGGDLIESYNFRIPANDPANNRIDPNLLPTRERRFDAGLDYALTTRENLSVRYTHQRLDRTIENVGVIGDSGTDFYVANPGFGLAAQAPVYPAGVLAPPPAHREYDAVDISVSRRMTGKLQFVASYTWSRLFGDYSGLASSDENGRAAPNSTKYYDNPWMSIDQNGRFVEGRLATDRPHTLKLFATYVVNSRWGSTNFAPRISAFSGTPLSTTFGVLGDPMFPLGRGDLGRTPFFSNVDLLLYHEFRPAGWREGMRFRIEANATNLLNQAAITGVDTRYNHPNDGDAQFTPLSSLYQKFDFRQVTAAQGLRVSPLYGMANSFQAPRSFRVGLHFFF